jgi:predicted TIM-barrel enzyme
MYDAILAALTPTLTQGLATLMVAFMGWLTITAQSALATFKLKTNIQIEEKHFKVILEIARNAALMAQAGDNRSPADEQFIADYVRKQAPDAVKYLGVTDTTLQNIARSAVQSVTY